MGGTAVQLKGMPKISEGLSQDNHVDSNSVVSFKLDPKFTGDHRDAVCLTDIKHADEVLIQH